MAIGSIKLDKLSFTNTLYDTNYIYLRLRCIQELEKIAEYIFAQINQDEITNQKDFKNGIQSGYACLNRRPVKHSAKCLCCDLFETKLFPPGFIFLVGMPTIMQNFRITVFWKNLSDNQSSYRTKLESKGVVIFSDCLREFPKRPFALCKKSSEPKISKYAHLFIPASFSPNCLSSPSISMASAPHSSLSSCTTSSSSSPFSSSLSSMSSSASSHLSHSFKPLDPATRSSFSSTAAFILVPMILKQFNCEVNKFSKPLYPEAEFLFASRSSSQTSNSIGSVSSSA